VTRFLELEHFIIFKPSLTKLKAVLSRFKSFKWIQSNSVLISKNTIQWSHCSTIFFQNLFLFITLLWISSKKFAPESLRLSLKKSLIINMLHLECPLTIVNTFTDCIKSKFKFNSYSQTAHIFPRSIYHNTLNLTPSINVIQA
jgi:hypothetical protein